MMNGGRKAGETAQNDRKQHEEPPKALDRTNAKDQTQDRLPELVAERKKIGGQCPVLLQKEEKNKLPAHSRRQLDASVTIVENKMKGLSLRSFHQSMHNPEAIVATDVTQKLLEDRAKQKRRKASEQLINKGQTLAMESNVLSETGKNVETQEQDSKDLPGWSQPSYAQAQPQGKLPRRRHKTRNSKTTRQQQRGLETIAVGANGDLNQHLPVPPEGNNTWFPRRQKANSKHWPDRTRLAIACYQLEEEIKEKIRECEEKEAQIRTELKRLQSALERDETKLEKEKEDKMKAIIDKEQQLKKELARLRRIKRLYKTKQQPQQQQQQQQQQHPRSCPCALQVDQQKDPGRLAKEESGAGRKEDFGHLPSPPQDAATRGSRRVSIRGTRTTDRGRRASQVECYTTVNVPRALYSSQLLVFSSPNSSVVIVASDNSKTETS